MLRPAMEIKNFRRAMLSERREPRGSCCISGCLRHFSGASSSDKIPNILHHEMREENQQAFQVWLSKASFPRHPPGLPAQGWQAALDRRRSGANGRAGQEGGVGTIPKYVGIGRLEELDVVLHAAVGAL